MAGIERAGLSPDQPRHHLLYRLVDLFRGEAARVLTREQPAAPRPRHRDDLDRARGGGDAVGRQPVADVDVRHLQRLEYLQRGGAPESRRADRDCRRPGRSVSRPTRAGSAGERTPAGGSGWDRGSCRRRRSIARGPRSSRSRSRPPHRSSSGSRRAGSTAPSPGRSSRSSRRLCARPRSELCASYLCSLAGRDCRASAPHP